MNHEKKADSIFKNIARYSASNLYRHILGLLTAFIRPKLLMPEMYGLWSLLNIIPTYSSYLHLGSRSSMRFLIPYYESRRDQKKIQEIKGNVFHGTLYMNLFFFGVLILFAFRSGLSMEVKAGLIASSLIVMLTCYYEHYISLLKGYQKFGLVSASNVLRATITFILSAVLIYYFGIYGAFTSVIFSLLMTIFFLKARQVLEHHFGFQMGAFLRIVKMGFPILLFNIVAVLLRTFDKIIVSFFLGNEQLGYYGISTMILGALMNIPGVSREVLEPRHHGFRPKLAWT